MDRVKGRQKGAGAAPLGWQQGEALSTPKPGREITFGLCIRKPGPSEPGDALCRSYSHGTQGRGNQQGEAGGSKKKHSSTAETKLTQVWGPCWERLGKMNGPERGRRWRHEERGGRERNKENREQM